MKTKIVASFFVVAILVLVFSQISFAQDIEGKFGIGARVSYANDTKDDYYDFGVNIDVEADDAAMYGANLTYFVHRYFSFELSGDYYKTDVDFSAPGASGEAGELTQIPILLSARRHLSTNPKVSPYVTVGIGYYINDFDANSTNAELYYGAGADVDVEDSFGFHIGLGVEYFFSETFAVNLDFKYVWTEIEADLNVGGSEDFDVNPVFLGLGIKFYF